jgi:hypothetical protein
MYESWSLSRSVHPVSDPASVDTAPNWGHIRPRVVFGNLAEIFAYIETSDINEFLAVQEDLLLRIMDVVGASGSGFAFPSQTIYAGTDAGLDAGRRRAAETKVQQWRAVNELGLPYFRPEQLASLAGTLDYPPKGSAACTAGFEK